MLVSRQRFAGISALAAEWRPDLARATRATAGLMLPLLLAETGQIPLHLIFAAIAAQNMAMADVRGSYSLRLAVLSSGGFLLGLAAALGSTELSALVDGTYICGFYGHRRRRVEAPQRRLRTAAGCANRLHLSDGVGSSSRTCGGSVAHAFCMGRRRSGHCAPDGSVAFPSAAPAASCGCGVLARGGKPHRRTQ